jgi:hypothetical protein
MAQVNNPQAYPSFIPYKFSVYRNGAWTTSTSLTVVNFDTKVFDTSSNVDIVTNVGRFTAPIAGFYQFNASIGATAVGSYYLCSLFKNGSEFARGTQSNSTNNASAVQSTVACLVQCAANDYIEIAFQGGGQGGDAGAVNTWFTGFLVSIA